MRAWQTMVRPRVVADPPLLWVGDEHVQWGDDPTRIPASPSLIRWVHGLDGTATLESALAHAPGPPSRAEQLVSVGYRCGYISDAATVPVRWFWGDERDRVATLTWTQLLIAESRGALRLEQVNRILDTRGTTRVCLTDPHDHLTGMAEAIEACGLHISPPAALDADDVYVVVSCGHTDVTHDALGHMHDAGSAPVVHIGLSAHAAVVGPLVVPGETSCLRCDHLHRCDRDEGWSLRAVQWAQRQTRACTIPSTPLTSWAVYTACTLITLWSDARLGHRPREDWHNIAYRLPLHTLIPTREERPFHPLCGCTWRDPG